MVSCSGPLQYSRHGVVDSFSGSFQSVKVKISDLPTNKTVLYKNKRDVYIGQKPMRFV